MPRILIDGKEIETEQGQTVIEAAYTNGLQITHFCWHPELSISGNCRMCLVEVGMPKRLPDGTLQNDESGNPVINYFPKLQIACATVVSDGMHIRTKTDSVVHAQEAVMEFFLINHPLDCPICDEAGQCKLQEYAYCHSRGESRFEEEKVHAPKRQSWGPTVMFDAERCIKCSRCIRFAQEIAGQDVLTFVNRGDHVTIELFQGKQFDNPYSMNVIDICPVGALTSKDFRFKSRVWDMSFNDSICPGCARGCNIKIGVRNNEILRMEPRSNPYVNKYWMCDYGRLTQYENVNENRITNPMIRWKEGLISCSWDEAVSKAADLLKKYTPDEIMVLGSSKATNEGNYVLSKFAKDILKTKNIDIIRDIDLSFADDFLKVSDKKPNYTGACEVGIVPNDMGVSVKDLPEKMRYKNIKVMYVITDLLISHRLLLDELDDLELLIVHAQNHTYLTEKADIIFSSSTFAEVEGTYINVDRRVQHFTPALVTAENLRYMGMKMSRIDKFGAPNDRWTQHELRNCLPNWKILMLLAEQFGVKWDYIRAKDIFKEICSSIESFKGMSYELLDEYQGLILGKSGSPDPIVTSYESYVMKPN
jgi:NADH-quinone oxidoreductase subunit G